MSKKLILLFTLVIWSNGVIAQSFYCKVTEHGFQHAAAASNISKDWIEYYFPPHFEINAQKAYLWKDVVLDVTGGNRVSTFQIRNRNIVNGTVYHDVYRININEFTKKAVVRITAVGYEALGPVRYTCESSKGTTSSSSGGTKSNNQLKNEFSKLSRCNKKYLQQFLKGQGLYFGTIDGRWGKGTNKAVNAALKLPTFENMSANAFFKKIQQNPICN